MFEEYKLTKTIFPLSPQQVTELGNNDIVVSLSVFNKLFNKNLVASDFDAYAGDYAGAYDDLLKTSEGNYTISLQVLNNVDSCFVTY